MVAGDVPPHEWLAKHLPADGWSLDAQADGPDGASYRAVHGDLVLYVLATWEDLHAPWEVPDWYAVTAGIEAARSAPHDSSRGAPREP